MHYGSLFNNALQGQSRKESAPPADIEITLECTLEEFYCGSMKEINFQRGILKDNARSIEQEFVCQEI
jgi:DnaJ-class molecular chaperone